MALVVGEFMVDTAALVFFGQWLLIVLGAIGLAGFVTVSVTRIFCAVADWRDVRNFKRRSGNRG